MKKTFKRLTAILMAMVMVFAMSSSVFATGEKDATINIYIVKDDGTPNFVQSDSVASGQSVYAAIESTLKYYEPKWDSGKDVFDGSETKYLNTFIGYGPVNLDHYYAADNSGWSKDWGWLYTVNGVMPSFPDNPDHGMAMNQYMIKTGDVIDLVYTLTDTSWDSQYKTTFSVVYPWK